MALILITLFASYQQIEAGHVGVVRTFGEITGSIGEGPNFIAPWQTVQVENVQTRKAEFRNPTPTSRTTNGSPSAASRRPHSRPRTSTTT